MMERREDKTLSSAGILLLLTAAAMIWSVDFGKISFSAVQPGYAYHNLIH
ncbi:MAG: hypothetical protein JJ866_04225 [Roseibium sp.]|nr:hypothetical protein [Roseibium sp.]MBO6891128.1 hypothetical protein [Roseibium sp.]MBO6933054.1 hypothetical protein [Roseibium sp.]